MMMKMTMKMMPLLRSQIEEEQGIMIMMVKNVMMVVILKALMTMTMKSMPLLSRGERIVFSGLNTNTNTIRSPKFGRIRIRILFGFKNLAKYEYEYHYSGSTIRIPNYSLTSVTQEPN